MNFNTNYRNHKFVDITKEYEYENVSNDICLEYECQVCNMQASLYHEEIQYYIINKNSNEFFDSENLLSCEEVLIKRLL